MRILFILHETGEHSGAWKSASLLLQGLRNHHIDCMVLVPDKKEIYSYLVKEGYNVKSIKIVWNNTRREKSLLYKIYRVPFDVRRMLLSFVWFLRACVVVKRFHPDIIHTNSSVFYLGYDLAKFLKIPHIWHIREYGDRDFGLDISKTQKRLSEHISYNICIANCILEQRGLNKDIRSIVVYNGILPLSSIRFTLPKDNYFLYVGSLGEGKGIRDIIDAWLMFLNNRRPATNLKLKIAGGHIAEIEKWKRYIRSQSSVPTNIEFLGMRDDVGELMSHSIALLVASYSEAFGRVTAEGMFNGTIVIGRDTAGTKEQFDNGVRKTGKEIAFRFNTTETLKNSLIKVANLDSGEYKEFVHRAQSVVSDLYSTEVSVSKVIDFYKRVIVENSKESV